MLQNLSRIVCFAVLQSWYCRTVNPHQSLRHHIPSPVPAANIIPVKRVSCRCNRRLVRNRQTVFVRIVFSVKKQPETVSLWLYENPPYTCMSDQRISLFWQYCKQAPQLSVCSPGQQAMTDELVSYRDERLSMAHHEFIHCRCPAGHQLKQTDTQWRETAESDVMLTTKACTKVSALILTGGPRAAAGEEIIIYVRQSCQDNWYLPKKKYILGNLEHKWLLKWH